jgi:hypothetical protein
MDILDSQSILCNDSSDRTRPETAKSSECFQVGLQVPNSNNKRKISRNVMHQIGSSKSRWDL